MASLKISNRAARWLFLEAQQLSRTPTGTLDLAQMIHDLGLVQLDTIQVISRAHHHILWSRNQNYREPMLDKLLRQRGVFEHFTHDASVLPMAFLPYWQRQFRRCSERIVSASWWKGMPDAAGRAEIRDRIAREGALSTHDFDTRVEGRKEMWKRPPHKLALDFMWYAGELATCHRVNFTKYYDLGERVFPAHLREQALPDHAQIDWLCRAALGRIGFGTQGDVQRFWDAMSAAEARDWLESARGGLVPVEVEGADGAYAKGWALADIEDRLARVQKPSSRLRILNPFDPVIRDRNRLKRLFGFDYRVEMFVPAAKRKWGYYVYPLLEGDRFVGRIEAKADRKAGKLTLLRSWGEPGVKWGAARQRRLEAELARMTRLAQVETLEIVAPTPQ